MDLSILIVNWNTRDYLTHCLQSLQATAGYNDPVAQTLTYGSYTTEVFVVDNASADGSAAVMRQHFPWARLIVNDRNVGFAPANNQACRASAGRYVLLLNSDTEVQFDAIGRLINFMDTHPDCGASGARLLNADGSLQPSCQPMLTPWREFWRLTFLDRLWRRATYDMARWPIDQAHAVDTIKGACLIVRRAALDKTAPLLDEQYFMYTEEIDLCYRLLNAGWQLAWVPDAVVVHFGEASSSQIADKMYVQLYRSKVQFYRKIGGERNARRFKFLVALAYWPRFLLAALANPITPKLSRQAPTFRHLLRELQRM